MIFEQSYPGEHCVYYIIMYILLTLMLLLYGQRKITDITILSQFDKIQTKGNKCTLMKINEKLTD